MNSYNRKIADRLLHNELKMIHNTDQPEMFNNELESLNALHESVFYGGARPLKYVQAGETVATSEPSTLSVGSYPFENVPDHLVEGGNIRKRRGRPRKEDGGNIFDTIGSVTKTVAPLAIPMMMAAGLEKKKRGRPSKGGKINVLGTLKKVGRTVAPVVQKVAVPIAQNMAQQALTNYMSGSAGAGLKRRGRQSKIDGGKFNFLGTLKKVGKSAAPIAQEIGTKVVLPVATQALTNYALSGAGLTKTKRTKQTGGKFNLLGTLKNVGKTVAPIAQKVAVPIAQNMAQQALTNYMTGSAGAGLHRTTKRGQLIKKVMAEQGCTLGEASKYIKTHQLN